MNDLLGKDAPPNTDTLPLVRSHGRNTAGKSKTMKDAVQWVEGCLEMNEISKVPAYITVQNQLTCVFSLKAWGGIIVRKDLCRRQAEELRVALLVLMGIQSTLGMDTAANYSHKLYNDLFEETL